MSKAWTQAECTDCWVREYAIQDPMGSGGMVRVPMRFVHEEGTPWEQTLEICCKCGRITTSGIYIRIDPNTVPFSQEDNDDD